MQLVPLVLQEAREHLDPLDHQAPLDLQVLVVPLEAQETLVYLERQEEQDQLVPPEAQDSQAL